MCWGFVALELEQESEVRSKEDGMSVFMIFMRTLGSRVCMNRSLMSRAVT